MNHDEYFQSSGITTASTSLANGNVLDSVSSSNSESSEPQEQSQTSTLTSIEPSEQLSHTTAADWNDKVTKNGQRTDTFRLHAADNQGTFQAEIERLRAILVDATGHAGTLLEAETALANVES